MDPLTSRRMACRTAGLAACAFLVLGSWAAAEHVGVEAPSSIVDATLASYSPTAPVSGRLTIAGSDTMQPLLAKLALEFRRHQPDMKLAVQGSRNHGETTVQPLTQAFLDGLANSRRGDGKTSGHFGSNDVQLLASSRPLTNEEIKKFRLRHGYEPTAIVVAQDAVALYVHATNPITGLTLAQADALFSATRKRGWHEEIRTWGQLGLADAWQEAPIRVYGRDPRSSSGTVPFFKQVVLLDGAFKKDVEIQPGSASIVLKVMGDPFAIGYSSIGFQTSSIRTVPLAERSDAPFVPPTVETVMDGTYPLSRPLYLYVKKDPKKDLDPKIAEFLKFANSREGQETIVRAGAYPLTPAQTAANRSALEGNGLRAASFAADDLRTR